MPQKDQMDRWRIFWFLGDLKSIMVVVIDANGPILDQIDNLMPSVAMVDT